MRVLVTGGCGFIGSNFIHHLIQAEKCYQIINIDSISYAGNKNNLSDVESSQNYRFRKVNVRDKDAIDRIFSGEKIDVVVHFAAQSHVDNSISDPSSFISTNIEGTRVLLETLKEYKKTKFLYISTDEVYGEVEPEKSLTEDATLSPNSPYSASKAGAEHLVRAFRKTYGIPTITTRPCNNYGPFQHPEKFIPKMVTKALREEPLPVYGDGSHVREWLHVRDHVRVLERLLWINFKGQVFNVGSGTRLKNLQVVHSVLDYLGKSEDLVEFVEDRPGHDRRYAIDSTKLLNKTNWSPNYNFDDGLKETVNWYVNHEKHVSSSE